MYKYSKHYKISKALSQAKRKVLAKITYKKETGNIVINVTKIQKIIKDYCENFHTNRKVYIILKHDIFQKENMKIKKPS